MESLEARWRTFATRTCTSCGKTKPIKEYHKDKRNKTDGRIAICKTCAAKRTAKYRKENPEKAKEASRRCHAKNGHKYRRRWRQYHLEKTYGISPKEYDEMVEECNNKCWICGANGEDQHYGKLVVDHNHDTNKVRGLLCRQCNAGLGHFKDNKELLTIAIMYLQEDDDE